MKSLIDIRRDLHKIPEIGFQEYKTQQYVLAVLQELKTEFMHIKTWRTGIIVTIEGTAPLHKIGWRTDMDALEISEETALDYSSEHEGFMHACGHDFHMTIALGLVERFTTNQPIHTVIIYFQPAEEGPGGAEPMLTWVRANEPLLVPDYMFACHIAPEYPVGTVATRAGMLFANTSELFIDLKGRGGHAAFPHQTRDMTVAAASLIMQLQTIVSRAINPLEGSVVTIGKMTSGTVQNIIAENARLEGTIRTVTAESMMIIKDKIKALCTATEIAFDCELSIDFGSGYYQVFNDAICANALLEYAATRDELVSYNCPPAMTGEDFGYFLKEIPGAMFWAGANTAFGLHHSRISPDEKLLLSNIDFVEQFIRQFK
ncbi:N-acetyldiaminopimelate deacetylase [Kurthia sibirica]|uniref:N-acetyldiaminopimelate deacetylase n=1 Tax=Kurthia sibirica TaxID=202750 RepID=A0A2U3AQC9_9BACL|nr:N-acetyldiaminopimelate deacetylase [Kurthia sibirica]PWI26751.1 N-acetyldiaminopimelate deacetylase [Kurthia sibirica]GEK32719.1 N-acetyldiaminopimelate deacetylase [Kurthia sibirica]